ncbi:hypothetical protein FIBSPDRAFT_873637 [Athelia psychrophila]|uniref:Uncharacterized protein n=1 Tax=Athelia psychrophila TaxID=1759441 RepID=A0A165YBK5_9AGAM|nr:hypothetical protein FIBSPDRAFT_873637 [Fibularhizoctonia sp. CBS 109695]
MGAQVPFAWLLICVVIFAPCIPWLAAISWMMKGSALEEVLAQGSTLRTPPGRSGAPPGASLSPRNSMMWLFCTRGEAAAKRAAQGFDGRQQAVEGLFPNFDSLPSALVPGA